jgi:hypothetical protein
MARRREGKAAHQRGLAELRRDPTGKRPFELGAEGGGCRRLIYLHAARLARWRSIRA